MNLPAEVETVSYTHLDVYKRQGLIYGGLTRGALIASVPARSGLTGDRPTAGTLPADGLT